MTVREHMEAAGYDVSMAWNAKRLANQGTMECDSIHLRTFRCCPYCEFTEMVGVEAVAIVPYSDGGMHPYPTGWPKSMEARITAYFPIKEV